MRIVTFNILHGRSLLDDTVDVDRFAAAVRGLDADILRCRRSIAINPARTWPI